LIIVRLYGRIGTIFGILVKQFETIIKACKPYKQEVLSYNGTV